MLQPEPSPRNRELLEGGIFVIFQAYREGKINFKELRRLLDEWSHRVLDDDEDVEGCYSSGCLDS